MPWTSLSAQEVASRRRALCAVFQAAIDEPSVITDGSVDFVHDRDEYVLTVRITGKTARHAIRLLEDPKPDGSTTG